MEILALFYESKNTKKCKFQDEAWNVNEVQKGKFYSSTRLFDYKPRIENSPSTRLFDYKTTMQVQNLF